MSICDAHIHVVGDPALNAQVADRTYTAAPAPMDALLRVANPQGVTRFVVVQPSFYGTDNTVTLEAVSALGGNGRGVAVIDPAAVTPAELATLAAGGIAGLRINLYSTLAERRGGSMQDSFGAMAAVAQRYGWHVEVIATAEVLARSAGLFAASPVPVVIDHYGVHGGVRPGSDTGQALLGLLRLPHIWMKLSAPYRCSTDPLAVRPDPDWLAAILDAGAKRCVWGSDWPHPSAPKDHKPDDARLFDLFAEWAGGEAAFKRILVDNPVELYGLSPVAP